MIQPIPGEAFVIGVGAAAFLHEMICLRANKPEHLITRVIYRWRARYPTLVSATIIYFAGHFLEAWTHDPLTAKTWHDLGL